MTLKETAMQYRAGILLCANLHLSASPRGNAHARYDRAGYTGQTSA
jgi:hypothetical protein